MKKIFYILASAIVALGAVACENDVMDNIATENEGLSFVATIDNTKTDLEGLKTVWSDNDVITINGFEFAHQGEGKFTCTDSEVGTLKGQSDLTACYNEKGIDSEAGTAGAQLKAEGAFDAEGNASGFSFAVQNAFLKFTTTETVTLNGTGLFSTGDEVTIKGTGETQYVAINPVNATLSYSVNGVKCKEVNLTFEAKNIYNLGNLTAPVFRVYVMALPGTAWANWTKVNFYSWASDNSNNASWPGVDITKNTATVNGYEYNYYQYKSSWNGKVIKAIVNNGTTQTSDMEIGVLNQDYYIVYSASGYEVYTEAPAEGTLDAVKESEWSLAGDFNNWGNLVMLCTDKDNVFVAKGVQIGAYTKILVKKTSTWDDKFGGGINYLQKNKWMELKSGGSDIQVAEAGKYDIYFDNSTATKKLYLVAEGGDYTTVEKQTSNGPAPDLSSVSWGLCGAHNNWGANDTELIWDGAFYVAKNAKITGEFKVRADNSWSQNFGGKTITVDSATGMSLTFNSSGNCKLSKTGTFDIYVSFNSQFTTCTIWAKTPGSAAPTK